MNQNRLDKSNDNESMPTIETLDFLLDNINRDSYISQINKKIDEEMLLPNGSFYHTNDTSENTDSFLILILRRLIDTFLFIILDLSFVFFLISIVIFVFEIGISFYSVLILNYVFFVSSIVSYTMAPIYQSLSSDWINFVFSFTQVILASPIIAFFIFYILKSVVSLASFISDIPSVIISIFTMIIPYYKEFYVQFLSSFTDIDCKLIFELDEIGIIFFLFGISLALLIVTSALAYVEFCFNKLIILLGSIFYIVNTIQIIMLILPSYSYFFKTLVNANCKEIKYVQKYIDFLNTLFEAFPDEQESLNIDQSKLNSTESNLSESDSYDSDSVLNQLISKNNIKISNDGEDEKFIDDPDISDYVDEDEQFDNKFYSLINMMLHLLTAESYLSIYYYSTAIAFDKHIKFRKIILMFIFFILNLIVISYDIYKLTQNYSAYFLASVIIRFILIPLVSYYNITSIMYQRSKNKTLNAVLAFSSIFTIIIAIAIFFCFLFTDFYQNKYRINDLSYIPSMEDNINYTISDRDMRHHSICNYNIFDISAFDAFGYSLGGYDVKRNITVFDNQMKIFFGANYSNHITYKIHELDKHFLFLQYYDSSINTHIFAFRGYNSGPEVAFQLELLATHYIIPFFEDIVPFYELINDYWLGFYTNFLNSFGLQFFENDNLMVKYVHSIIEIYNEAKFKEDDQVIFSGINCGGVFAKILGTILHRKSISFISFPIDNDLFEIMFDFSSSYISLVTNVYNVDGFFSDQEPRYATNIGIDIPVFDQTKFCTSGICEINSKTDNVYRTFCTMSEICGKGNQFNYYCEKVIGKKDLETIRESLKDND